MGWNINTGLLRCLHPCIVAVDIAPTVCQMLHIQQPTPASGMPSCRLQAISNNHKPSDIKQGDRIDNCQNQNIKGVSKQAHPRCFQIVSKDSSGSIVPSSSLCKTFAPLAHRSCASCSTVLHKAFKQRKQGLSTRASTSWWHNAHN